MDPQENLRIWWNGRARGLGEPLIMTLVAAVLQDNDINAYFEERPRLGTFSPIYPDIALRNRDYKYKASWSYDPKDRTPIHLQYIRHFEQYYGSLKVDWEKRNHVPVKYYETPEVRAVDVVLNTHTGKFTRYKWWPFFPELKQMLRKAKISFIDLDACWRETYGIKGLNYVRKAKVYLGLDTGMAHYVSRFANGKALIINGGYVAFEFWSHPYDFEVIQLSDEDLPCRHCLLNKHARMYENKVCEYNHKCMREISPEMVFNRIEERLNGIS